MKLKSAIVAALVCSVAMPVPQVARADSDALIGLGVGAVIGACLAGACNNNRNRTTTTTTTRTPPPQQPARAPADEAVRTDQAALNHFGFPAGTPDGRMGRNTRNAIGNYQAYMGHPVTGQLNDFERGSLWNAYNRAQMGGGAAYPDVVAAEGQRGLLKAFEAESRGERYRPFGQTEPVPYYPPAPLPVPQPAPVPAAEPAPGLPNFSTTPTAASMADHCRSVEILTQANGQPMSPGAITDPNQALDEQFCGARGYAMSRGQQLIAGVQGVTDSQLREQCDGLVPTMAPVTADLAGRSPAEGTQAAASHVAQFQKPDAELLRVGEICLGVGYQTDKPDVALASSMLLVAVGAYPYGELFGHHLRNGFGTTQNAGAADGWYDTALGSLEQGADPAFLPTLSPQRVAVMRAALSGQAMPAATTGGLPTFISQGN